ncbi:MULTISPECIES: LexA family protein [Acinetobacter]|uniref:LexA family protein n=1 Tax=Acinetobacter TaxID=469 RepID=UPI0015D1633A|nr:MULTISPECIES: translesion error-prone DNA polymerase V autoproteolytic subunit [Acinetobacter]MCO8060288.1 translesion error-prone DNA polymerase V autoproteolytic subunit [Acinetobacter towneri]MCO8065938.1 translesion error-prone DNA polymerase V autoproteolytic subunit [Acinetobacter towneri]MDD4853793.1 translesion error-prone DNA polymerase V autoproteolytic subunit [Acinetobacter towneri]MDO5541686.1 translesion error-prone DNA polymerase V autoproteolytic subunit [Acinetobacter sp.]U
MSKKLPIYFSDAAWASLQKIMGADGKPSPSLNALLEQIELLNQHDFQALAKRKTLHLPVTIESIPAGFPSPAQDYIDKNIDLNEYLISNENATFLNVVRTTSMVNAGLEYGDIVLVDRSKEAKHRSIVVALIDQKDLTIKRLMITAKMSKSELAEHFGEDYDPATLPEAWLKAESPDYDSIYLKDGQTFEVFAVVTWNLKNLMV